MSRLRIAIGFVSSLALLLLGGELYSRTWPPADVIPFLGGSSPRSGPYQSDPLLAVDYASIDAFHAVYADRLDKLGWLSSSQRTWLWLGNSFVQGAGMLGDTAAGVMPEIRMFYLKRNEPFHLRIAQVRQLLRSDLRPELILFVILPVDVGDYQLRPLSSISVNNRGAITYAIGHPPFPFDALISRSNLARTVWIRRGEGHSFRPSDIMAEVPSRLGDQLAIMLGVLAETAREHGVPVILVLLPNREQIFGKGGFALQDKIAAIAGPKGMDVFDARAVFETWSDKRVIFLSDWHFTPAANRGVFDALLAHISTKGLSGFPVSGVSR
jgi:hypothetical protein